MHIHRDLNTGMRKATHIQFFSALTHYTARLFFLFLFPKIFGCFPQNANHTKVICPAGGINHRYCISGLRACLWIYSLWCLENPCVWLPRPSRWWFLELFFILLLSSCLLHFVSLLHCSTLFFFSTVTLISSLPAHFLYLTKWASSQIQWYPGDRNEETR